MRTYRSALSIALSLGLAMLPAISTQAQVASEKTTRAPGDRESLEALLDISFETEDPDEGKPESGTVGAGSRDAGKCGSDEAENQPLTLLVPANAVALTVAERPTLLVYVPETMAEAAELSLRDEQGNGIYQTTIAWAETPGIMRIQMPASAPSLEVGQTYQWSVAMICDRDDRLRDRVVDGWIRRTEANMQLTQQLETASIPEQVVVYAQHGIWYDTISTLAELRSTSEDSTVVTNAWKQLLTSESVQLEEMLGMPLIQPPIGES